MVKSNCGCKSSVNTLGVTLTEMSRDKTPLEKAVIKKIISDARNFRIKYRSRMAMTDTSNCCYLDLPDGPSPPPPPPPSGGCDCCISNPTPPIMAISGSGGCSLCSDGVGTIWQTDTDSPYGILYGCGFYVNLALGCLSGCPGSNFVVRLYCTSVGVYQMSIVEATGLTDYPGPFPVLLTKVGPLSFDLSLPTCCGGTAGALNFSFTDDPCIVNFTQNINYVEFNKIKIKM